MDSYLEIAQKILRHARRPLGPRKILETAYQLDLVPSHLFGKTQHKTLQARISEDILNFRDQSPFFRTEPGKFFLREFITDTSLPPEYRDPIAALSAARATPSQDFLTKAISALDTANNAGSNIVGIAKAGAAIGPYIEQLGQFLHLIK